jgi:hypothetical protein
MTEREADNQIKISSINPDIMKKASQRPDLTALEKSLNDLLEEYES